MLIQLLSVGIRKGEGHVLLIHLNVTETSKRDCFPSEELESSAWNGSLVFHRGVHLVGGTGNEVVDLRLLLAALEVLQRHMSMYEMSHVTEGEMKQSR